MITTINREIKATELEQLNDLLHSAYQADQELGIHFKAATITMAEMKEQMATMKTFVTVDDDKIIATVSVRLPWSLNKSPYLVPHLGWVATNGDYLHQGYSKKLIHWVEEHVIKLQMHSPAVTLGTAVEHPWLASFYNGIGYEPIATQRKYADHLTVYMVKILDQTILERAAQLNNLGLATLNKGELKDEF